MVYLLRQFQILAALYLQGSVQMMVMLTSVKLVFTSD